MKNRLDKEMVGRGLVPSRSKAQELIDSSLVLVNGKVITKCGFIVNDELFNLIQKGEINSFSFGGFGCREVLFEVDSN